MPSATVRRLYEDQIPSFMSVYDLDSDILDQSGVVTLVDPKSMEMEAPKLHGISQPQLRPSNTAPTDPAHKHNDSTSTQNTESADSSPTTTVSCTDSSDLTDPSPSSSPDSPVNLLPLSSFAPTPFAGLSGMASLSVSDSGPSLARPMTSPAPRRAKNMKGLSIQPPFNSLSSSLVSEPSSPSFIKPTIPGMKRKPSQLSLKTNSSDLVLRPTLEVPSSPSVAPILQRRALKHSTSSPHMLSGLKSATFGPVGGMTIPTVLERNESGLSEFFRPSRPAPPPPVGLKSAIAEEESPIKAQVANPASFDYDPYHEVENNEDQKTPGYPDGPICIYNDNVYLYLEPTAEEAARFDLVINVAREVRNPFEPYAKNGQQALEDKKPADLSPIPDTAVTTASFATAFEFLPDEPAAETPTTPKAQSFKEPEYIHMPWDHHTDIGGDLMRLCEKIDRTTKEGKKVLVHCQQGASRSASLIIAYGMYQNPELSVNDAYHAAQAKSRWISPNMRLMYCLQDFQKEMSKKKLPNSGLKVRTGRSPTKHRMTLSADNIDLSPPTKEPLTAPLPREDAAANATGPEISPSRARGMSTPNRGEPISPGPSSAPSSFSWTEKEDETDPGKYGRFNLDSMVQSSQNSPPPSQTSQSSQSDFGFTSIGAPPKRAPSPGLVPVSISRPAMSPGFAPSGFGSFPTLSNPPPSPGFKPPPSPGFGAHRFGGDPQSVGGFGFLPLSLGAPTAKLNNVSKEAAAPERHITVLRDFSDHAALMSPRAETMTSNPLHDAFDKYPTGMQFVEVPPTPSEGLFSPRESMFPRDPFFPFGRPLQNMDPRSPPTKGETPIVRSIDEVL
ncbi:hypothetical protein QBC46DRAFT_251372 [Diplogelasinospora grovesii]|uniref:protein-tyrosine-phosphatase n=1 Tax=Diplogelasinospora grovesii TaxID=303347 RepID=A0AAN6S865_9PEZI|nr:hypothetical protein QBC46DRAFT_251372 [Diplogelasinospora grovesii]